MTVECPRCGTLYRRPARAERGTDTTYRCARCRHVFTAGGDEPAMLSVPETSDDESRFAFDDDEDGTEEKPAIVVEDDSDEARAPRMKSPVRFAIRALLFVMLLYGVLSIYLYTHPESVAQALGRVPLIGAHLVETRLRPTAVRLTGVRGQYERVQGDRLVFVIAGNAVNNSAVPVHGIQIEGRITGAREQRQVVYCGAAPRDVQDLSLREIALLQTLEPPKDWALGPGEQASFLVVFATPPADLHEFGAEVVAVQAPTRRS
jgi:predicted Zn finger-like uncharacterized protein